MDHLRWKTADALTRPVVELERVSAELAERAIKIKKMAVPRHIASGAFQEAMVDFQRVLTELEKAYSKVMVAAPAIQRM